MDTDELVADLLADKNATKARELMLAWSEARTSSWADADRDAQMRAASNGHLPQIRGQLRYHSGQKALAESCHGAGLGAIPIRTTPPGGSFMVARVGRFGLVSLTVKQRKLLPRRSITRKILSQANESLDPQVRLFEEEKSRPVTELAYFGCLIAIPSERDPSVPAELCLGIPNVGISHWIAWIPLDRLHGMLQSRADGAAGAFGVLSGEMPDLAFPTFRVPKQRSDAEDEGAE